MDKTLPEQIAANTDDVKALLESNSKLSVALLARLLKEHEELDRRQHQALESEMKLLRKAMEHSDKTNDERIKKAGRMFQALKKDVDKLKDGN
jgi:hypothetical protein